MISSSEEEDVSVAGTVAAQAVPVEPLMGKVVIDTGNYYPARDGHIPELDDETTTSAELLQAHLPTSKVVKTFNHILAADLTRDGTPSGTPNRRRKATNLEWGSVLSLTGDPRGDPGGSAFLPTNAWNTTATAGLRSPLEYNLPSRASTVCEL